MASKTIRTILALDGEREFRAKLQQCNSVLTMMKANVKQLTAEYELDGKSIKSLKDRKNELQNQSKQLNDKLKILKDGVKATQEAYGKANVEYKEACQLYGEDSEEAKRLEKALQTLERRTNSYNTQIANTNTELLQNQQAIRDVNAQIDKGSNLHQQWSKDLVNLGTGIGKLGLDGMKLSVKAVTEEVKLAAEGLAAYTAAVAAAAVGIAKFATSVGTSFEAGMSGVEAIANATGEEMDMLTEKAKELGSSTKFTATEVSEGFNYMAMAGWSAEEMMEGIDGVINLAAASGEDLGLVSDIVTDSLTAFKMSADDAGRYADILAQASSNANTNVAMMGETFQYCAPIAGALGYKVDDMATAIGLMANAGIKGSMAGTSLRSIMTNLSAPTDNSAAAMEKLGISLENEDGTMKTFAELLENMREGFQGLSEAEAAAAAKAIAGKPGMSGLLALINASDEDVAALATEIENCAGAAEKMANVKLDNLQGDITILKSATEGLGLSIYDTFSVKLRKGTQFLTQMVNKLHDGIENGYDMNAVIKDVANNIGIEVGRAIQEMITNLPYFLEGFNTVVLSLADQIIALMPTLNTELLPALVTGFGNLVKGLVERLPEFLDLILEGANNLLTLLVEDMDLIGTGFTIITTLLDGIKENLPQLLQTGANALIEFITGIADNLPELITTAVDILLMLVDAILDNLDELIEAGLKIIISLSEAIIDNLDRILPYVPKIVSALVNALIDNLPLLVEAAVDIMLALGVALVDCIDLMLNVIPDICDQVGQKFKETNWLAVGASIMTGIFNGISDMASKAGEKIGGAVQSIKDFFTGGFDIHSPSKWAKEVIGKNIVLGQIEGIEETAEKETTNLFGTLSKFGSLMTQNASALAPVGAGSVTVNLNGNITLNNTEGDIDNLIQNIETRIYERQIGRGV